MPFVHSRRILWGETDAARIAYTARFLDFAMEALERWFQERLGCGWYEMNVDLGIGTPFVHASMDFRSPVTPRDVLDSEVRLVNRGRSSLRFAVTGRIGERLVYEAVLACVFVEAAAMKPVPAPERFAAALAAEDALGACQTQAGPGGA
ncbi:acyl-CoA thioesterase [Paracraurococcus lichenis]|uniref:Thioesterase family protein n=1 Tax=Paracraurococcus lichenis TaxID=3064888 RepID=A0ABT9DW30_9PROT|nr:thioesterase family protein [Paracraurococcus sp. LOR1-02]MDO9708112.1 thioesterase family protein [Paracraurococcus sp. LOR1-02]